MRKKKIVDINPDPSLFSKLGKTGYTIPKAFSEIIDNSIDNRVDNHVKVSIEFQVMGEEIRIKDNGSGMNEEQLTKALRIAYHEGTNKKRIGEYGFGLKSSTAFLGKNIIIYTKTSELNQIIKFEYKENEFINSDNKWKTEIEFLSKKDMITEVGESFEENKKDGHRVERGTLIIIKDLNITLYSSYANTGQNGRLIEPLEKVYMLALGEFLDIEMNIKNKDGTIREPYFLKPYEFPALMFKAKFNFDLINPYSKHKQEYLSSKNIKGWIGISAPANRKWC